MKVKTKFKRIKVPINEVKPYSFNPRKNDEAVMGVMESIKKFGYHKKIVVDKHLVIIAGHTRYKALKRLGYDEIEVDRYEAEDSADDLVFANYCNEVRIKDNLTNEGSGYSEKVDEMISHDNLLSIFFEVPMVDVEKIEPQTISKKISKEDDNEVICPECGEVIHITS